VKTSVYRYLSITILPVTILCMAPDQVIGEDATNTQIDMEGMSIIGNNELPKALFIVPWKAAEAPIIPRRPLNSLINDELSPIDPDVFRRYLQYLDQLHSFALKTDEEVHDNN